MVWSRKGLEFWYFCRSSNAALAVNINRTYHELLLGKICILYLHVLKLILLFIDVQSFDDRSIHSAANLSKKKAVQARQQTFGVVVTVHARRKARKGK